MLVSFYHHHVELLVTLKYLGPAIGWYPIQFFLSEFVAYLGEIGVLCVGNGRHFSTPILMSMCNITFEVPRLGTFVCKKNSGKRYSRLYS